jgi:hypothetical protein
MVLAVLYQKGQMGKATLLASQVNLETLPVNLEVVRAKLMRAVALSMLGKKVMATKRYGTCGTGTKKL